MIKRIGVFTAVILATFVLGVACGGGNTIGGTHTMTTITKQLVFSASPVFSFASKTKKIVTASLVPNMTASAQSPTVPNLTGNYSGFCATTPAGNKFVIYGIGRWTDANCASAFSTFSNDGAPVIGDGVLSTLVIIGSGGTTDESGKGEVYVNGQLTSMTCTVGKATRCTDLVNKPPVHDGDSVVATVTTANGDTIRNLRVLIGKE